MTDSAREGAEQGEWVGASEAMERIGKTPSSFYRWLDDESETREVRGTEVKVFPPLGGKKEPRGSWRFRRRYLQAYLEAVAPDRVPPGRDRDSAEEGPCD